MLAPSVHAVVTYTYTPHASSIPCHYSFNSFARWMKNGVMVSLIDDGGEAISLPPSLPPSFTDHPWPSAPQLKYFSTATAHTLGRFSL